MADMEAVISSIPKGDKPLVIQIQEPIPYSKIWSLNNSLMTREPSIAVWCPNAVNGIPEPPEKQE